MNLTMKALYNGRHYHAQAQVNGAITIHYEVSRDWSHIY